MAIWRQILGGGIGLLALLVVATGCGGTSAAPGNQFTLEVQGNLNVLGAANLTLGKSQNTLESQVIVGTTLVEIKEDFFDGIGIQIKDFQASAQSNELGEIVIQITPNVVGDGILYKRDADGIPFGTSDVFVETQIELPNTGEIFPLGGLIFSANDPDPNKLPVLGNIPVISTTFQNQNRDIEVTELLILITPELASVLDD